jgi:hypothetical protein
VSRRAAALAAVVLVVVATPAPAVTEDIGYGLTCGLTVAETAQGQYTGVAEGGPWVAGEAGSRVALRCVVEVLGPEGWYPVWSSAPAPASTTSYVPPSPVVFGAPPAIAHAELQMCTEITVYKNPNTPPTVHRVDADNDPSNGGQCAKNAAGPDDLVYTGVFPPTLSGGRRCTYYKLPDGVPSPGLPKAVCVPSPV